MLSDAYTNSRTTSTGDVAAVPAWSPLRSSDDRLYDVDLDGVEVKRVEEILRKRCELDSASECE